MPVKEAPAVVATDVEIVDLVRDVQEPIVVDLQIAPPVHEPIIVDLQIPLPPQDPAVIVDLEIRCQIPTDDPLGRDEDFQKSLDELLSALGRTGDALQKVSSALGPTR